MDLDIGKKTVMYVAIFVVLFMLTMQLQGLALEPNVSAAYTDFYITLALTGMVGLALMVAFAWKYGDAFSLPVWMKGGIVAVWVIFIILISTSAGQILPVPKASAASFQLTDETELYTSSVIPGVLEDWAYLWLLPMALLLTFLLVAEYGLGIEADAMTIGILAVVACVISATGYNIWVIPGFTSAHVPAYGNMQNAYIGAWTFALGQSLVYVFTGWFLPIAHMVHNYIIAQGQIYQISAGGFNIVGG